MFNRLIFPAPTPSYGTGILLGELVHVPRNPAEPPKILSSVATATTTETTEANNKSSSSSQNHLPLSAKLAHKFADFSCGLFIRGPDTAKHVLMYCHPNAVDVGHMRSEFVAMARNCNIHCFLVEFQGYGLLQSSSPSEQQATEDGLAAFNFLTQTLGFPANKIILMGRSIGTGVTCGVAAQLQAPDQVPLAVLLQCPFTSIKACVKSLAGKNMGDFASGFVGERFENKKNVTKIKCPVTVIHGTKDQICPFQHGVEIVQAAIVAGKEDTQLIQLDCDHNDIPYQPGFAWTKDLVSKDTSNTSSSSSSPPTSGELIDRLAPYLGGPHVFREMQAGCDRPLPLTRVPHSPLNTTNARVITSPFSHLSHTLCYNVCSFLSLVRSSWELYLMSQEEALGQASSSEQVMQYVNMLAPSVLSNAVSSLRDRKTQLADRWNLNEYLELCAYLWGSPLSLGSLTSTSSSASKKTKMLVFGSSIAHSSSSTEENNDRSSVKIFATSSSDRQQSVSHFDELWGRISTTLRHVHKDLQEYAGKVRTEQEAFERRKQEQIDELRRQYPTSSGSTEQQQQQTENDQQQEGSSSSSTSREKSPLLKTPANLSVEDQIKKIQSQPFASPLPPFNTAASVSQHSERTEVYSPDVFWMIPPTMSKIFSDNIQKSKRTAAETMKRISESINSNSGNESSSIAMKPQPVTEKGAQWVQVEMERFVISNLVANHDENSTGTSSSSNVFDVIEKHFYSSMVSKEEEDNNNQNAEKKKWLEELNEQLQGPYLDGVLIPLPITVESSEAMKELLALFRRAPPSMCVQPPVVDAGRRGGKKGSASSSSGSDCVVQ